MRGITFSRPLIAPIQDGRKTQTRRIARPNVLRWLEDFEPGFVALAENHLSPYGYPGDLLWVREDAWMWCERIPNGTTPTGRAKWRFEPLRGATIHYAADHPHRPTIDVVHPETGNSWGWRMKVGRYLPQWASRIQLEVVAVRVERLQEITEEDARAEGMAQSAQGGFRAGDDLPWSQSAIGAFLGLWRHLHGQESLDANSWVWVVEFRRLAPGEFAERRFREVEAFARTTPFSSEDLVQSIRTLEATP